MREIQPTFAGGGHILKLEEDSSRSNADSLEKQRLVSTDSLQGYSGGGSFLHKKLNLTNNLNEIGSRHIHRTFMKESNPSVTLIYAL